MDVFVAYVLPTQPDKTVSSMSSVSYYVGNILMWFQLDYSQFYS